VRVSRVARLSPLFNAALARERGLRANLPIDRLLALASGTTFGVLGLLC
jgi:hypothetical protein